MVTAPEDGSAPLALVNGRTVSNLNAAPSIPASLCCYPQGQASMTKLRELLTTEPSVPEAPDAHELPPVAGDVVLDGVSFGYDPAVPVLRDVNLHIAAGETVCFVGATGAGKSTVAKLVTRFYDPTEGRVLIDGHDLRAVTLTSLRRQLGVVPQEPFLFTGTVRANLAFARPNATDDDLREAVALVGLEELIERLPERLDTEVHERGVSLSSGERQLLALSQAFLARPRVLVLDEATSNLDLQSETKVEAALDVLLEGSTAVIIAHRLSTAMRADRIVVVDHRHVVEMGSHHQLVARGVATPTCTAAGPATPGLWPDTDRPPRLSNNRLFDSASRPEGALRGGHRAAAEPVQPDRTNQRLERTS
jgi:ATP-binding cassette subfamily B protein